LTGYVKEIDDIDSARYLSGSISAPCNTLIQR